eukprot:m51a1_g1596 hypothetical protein (241) ;mRNA; f:157364-158161
METVETVYPTSGRAQYGVTASYDGHCIVVEVLVREGGTAASSCPRAECASEARRWLSAIRAGNFIVRNGTCGLELVVGGVVLFDLCRIHAVDELDVLAHRIAWLERECASSCVAPEMLESRNTSPFTLVNNNQWAAFPGLDPIAFSTTAERRAVTVFYNITTWSEGNTCLCTKVMIDGKEVSESRSITGDINFHTNTMCIPVTLEPGQHTACLHYRTPGNYPNRNLQDWNYVMMRVVTHA